MASFDAELPQEETRLSGFFRVLHLTTEEDLCVSPVAVGGWRRDFKCLGSFLVRQTGEVPQLDQLSLFW